MNEFFSAKEVKGLSALLVAQLTNARRIAKVPFVITSGYRDPAKNSKAGGVEDSSHTLGLGVDLRAKDSPSRFKILSALVQVGFNRIGVYNSHIHVDIDASKPANVIWTGTSH